jgi:hypothetical protein
LDGFDVEANTASGSIVVDGRQLSKGFGGGSHGRERVGHLREGNGALEIKANAVSGSIVVLRSNGSAAAPTPQDAPPPTGDPTTQIRTEGTSPIPQDIPPGDHPADRSGETTQPGDGSDGGQR